MNMFLEFILLGIGLAMDAFAVSICKGLGMVKVNKKQAFLIGLFFGGFQAIMPLIGWGLGIQFEKYINFLAHWIAFVLLVFIGGKMLYEVWKEKKEEAVGCACCENETDFSMKDLFVLAVATSIDALAVGVSFALLGRPILEAVMIIGILTFIISITGVYIGNFFGSRYKHKAEVVGGIILIFLGIKIVFEHYGFNFF